MTGLREFWRSIRDAKGAERRRRTADALTLARVTRAKVQREFVFQETGNPVEDIFTIARPRRRADGNAP